MCHLRKKLSKFSFTFTWCVFNRASVHVYNYLLHHHLWHHQMEQGQLLVLPAVLQHMISRNFCRPIIFFPSQPRPIVAELGHSLVQPNVKFKVCASNTKRTWAIIPSADKAKHFALFVYDMIFKPWVYHDVLSKIQSKSMQSSQ